MISWKHSFKKLNEEYEVTRKKRQALDNLLDTGKISQPTHNLFNREIDQAVAEIERQQKALLEKMASKVMELEEQIKTLEILLANLEIQHVTGEIDEEIYQHQTELLSMGLETARQELDSVKEATDQLSATEPTTQQEIEPEPEEAQDHEPEVKFLEEPTEQPEEPIVEAVQCTEEAKPTETEAKIEEKQET